MAGAVEHSLDNRRIEVKPSTLKTYGQVSTNYITGPILVGTPAERKAKAQPSMRVRVKRPLHSKC